jgi:hypothetical protein
MTTLPLDARVSDEDFRADFNLSGEGRATSSSAPGFKPWTGELIAQPGAYRDVPHDRYHGAEICDAPSISATGLKVLAGAKGRRRKGQTPRHFWETSNLNPHRKEREDTAALRFGRAFHDALLLPDAWDSNYHVLPAGFSRAKKKEMAVEIAEADAAIKAGLTCMKEDECLRVNYMADAMRADPLIAPFVGAGEAEVTFAWRDVETGVWLRARPDYMLADLSIGLNFKTAADASYSGFQTAIANNNYVQGAALELDGYLAIFGEAPSRYFHPVIEKPGEEWEPGEYLATALWELPAEDIERGRWLNRMAIRTFAECLSSNKWPGYTPEPELCGLPSYARHVIDNGGAAEPADDEITIGG